MSVDYTDRFDGNFIDTSVIESGVMEGDSVQFALHHHRGSRGARIDSDQWYPLGTISNVGSDQAKFRKRWNSIGPNDDTDAEVRQNNKCYTR